MVKEAAEKRDQVGSDRGGGRITRRAFTGVGNEK